MVEACKAVGLPEPEYGADGYLFGLHLNVLIHRLKLVVKLVVKLQLNKFTPL